MKPLEDMGKFATVVVDPPWPLALIGLKTGGLTPANAMDYQMVPLEEIQAFPIGSVLDDDALVFCWTVNKFIPETYRIVESWACAMPSLWCG